VGGCASSVGAQPDTKRYRVGMLDTSVRHLNPNLRHLEQALRERGYVEGQNLIFEYRSPDGRNDTFNQLASELVSLDVDVLVTRGTPAALAAKAASTTVPVVMAAAGDPHAIIHGAPAPSTNLTGFGAFVTGAERKRVEILKSMLPKVERVAALMNLSNPSRQAEWNEIAASARAMGVEAQVLDARIVADFDRLFDAATRWRADAMVIGSDTLVQTHQSLVIRLAASHRLPSVYTFRDFVDAGGLVSCGVSLPDLYRRAAGYVDRILKGAKPQELPVEPPTKLEIVVNLTTARALGLALSSAFLSAADEVMQ
jgi:putative ABC transport system substrate-binding protein